MTLAHGLHVQGSNKENAPLLTPTAGPLVAELVQHQANDADDIVESNGLDAGASQPHALLSPCSHMLNCYAMVPWHGPHDAIVCVMLLVCVVCLDVLVSPDTMADVAQIKYMHPPPPPPHPPSPPLAHLPSRLEE